MSSEKIEVWVVDGRAGKSLAINNTRVAGPKAWGGGTILHTFQVDVQEIIDALPKQPDPSARLRAAEEMEKAVNAFFDAPHNEHFAVRMNDGEMHAIHAMRTSLDAFAATKGAT